MKELTVQVPYGNIHLEISLPEKNLMGIIEPQIVEEQREDEISILRQAIENPIGSPRLRDLARSGQKVAIVTSDLTRPCPSAKMLPVILDELSTAGIPDEDIQIILGLGLHRPMSDVEIEDTVSYNIRNRIQVINHDPNNTVHLGVTSFGTPVEFFRPVVEADIRICLGNLEFHWFAGYSGGAKAILPGCASKACVTANHGLMVRPGSASGHIEDNPLRMDIEEAVALLGVDFILNVVVDGNSRIIGAVAGELTAAHRKGCETVAVRGKVKVAKKADIVVASAGGFPKDINLYQAHKGLENARYFVREGGVIILAAECKEGIGNKTFESWILSADSPAQVLIRIQNEFALGAHKAAAIADIVQKSPVLIVSNLTNEIARKAFLDPYLSIKDALKDAFRRSGPESQVLILPHAGSIILDFT